jgi:RHS repeat-associated protein
MQLASSTPIPDGLLATIALRNENSRLGVPSSEAALHLGHGGSKSEIVLGFDGSGSTTRVRSSDTGKERDNESGLDMMGARYYGSSMGRFMSPDPSGLVFASFANPQSLNLYSYAQNNPLIYTDPTGLDCAYLNNSGSGVESFDQHSSSGECGKTGGYWVDGGLTDAKINADQGTVQLTGTNNGTDVTHASYKDTSVYVDSWLNTSLNPAGHIWAWLGNNKWDKIQKATQTSYLTR